MDKVDYISWGVSGACLTSSLMFPTHATTVWMAGVALLLPVLWHQLRRPVNYESLAFDAEGFVFRPRTGSAPALKWSEITDAFYCRYFEPLANQVETY
jgi:hypothetical protein